MSKFAAETAAWSAYYKYKLNSAPVENLDTRLREVEHRLLIISDRFELHEKYPALKAAYDEYKIIEKLILHDI